ncbi:AlpA family transcriptional regulator [Methylobacter sp. BlB1]|jgi:prophage regulatory protein|uniref:helix-turn-helix transcriptional regulator n=1 Tax=Methylobacter sp. BlB1 TaxID=2785914 RepID=UPI00189610BC|nr:AlpA family phage regulatory protein [Methylobacter sp. BlB1]MBF6648956.1 AlpA family phage regulatory protein [Methylobacter sp. BlB1]
MKHKQHKKRNKVTYVPTALPAEGFVRLPSILAVLGISKNTFLNGIKAGKYPAGQLLGPRTRVWAVADIRAVLAAIERGEAA